MFVYLAPRGTTLYLKTGVVQMSEPWFITSEPLLVNNPSVITKELPIPKSTNLSTESRSRISLDNMLTDAMGNAVAAAFRR